MITDYTELIKELEIQAEKHKSVLLAVAADAIEQLVDDNEQLKKNKPQTGKWIEYGEPNQRGVYQPWYYKCSYCGAVGLADFNFCPNCGTRMVRE